jgi:hypothetical protein
MRSCTKMIDTGRRKFLSGAGLAAAGVAAATVVPTPAERRPRGLGWTTPRTGSPTFATSSPTSP